MKTIHMLLANPDRRLSNIVEVAVRDVCYDQAVVQCFRTRRLDDFAVRGSCEAHDLIVMAPEHLQPGAVRKAGRDPLEEAVQAIRRIKDHRQVPILAVGVSAENELRFLMAGADNVFGIIFNDDVFKAEVRRVLSIAPPVEEVPASAIVTRPSFTETLMKGFDRFRQAVGTK